MENLPNDVRERSIRFLAIPGSHDCFSATLDKKAYRDAGFPYVRVAQNFFNMAGLRAAWNDEKNDWITQFFCSDDGVYNLTNNEGAITFDTVSIDTKWWKDGGITMCPKAPEWLEFIYTAFSTALNSIPDEWISLEDTPSWLQGGEFNNPLNIFANAWGQTQTLTIAQQLNAGIRYFDFRAGVYLKPKI